MCFPWPLTRSINKIRWLQFVCMCSHMYTITWKMLLWEKLVTLYFVAWCILVIWWPLCFQVKGVLMDSKLPVDTLGKIWDLADMDKDGMLDRHEFMVVRIMVELLQICRSLLNRYLWIKKKKTVTYVEHTSVHLSVTWYQHINCLSDFHEMWYRVLYKEFCCEDEFCINQLIDSLHLRM